MFERVQEVCGRVTSQQLELGLMENKKSVSANKAA